MVFEALFPTENSLFMSGLNRVKKPKNILGTQKNQLQTRFQEFILTWRIVKTVARTLTRAKRTS